MHKNKVSKSGFYRTVRLDIKVLIPVLLVLIFGGFTVFAVSAQNSDTVAIPIVMYHSVLKDVKTHGKYVISPDELANDIKYLQSHGYTTILMQDLIDYTNGKDLPTKPVMLTFDDGQYNNYLYGFDLAKQYKVKFVVSPIVSLTEKYTEAEEENAYYSHLTWDRLNEMQSSGLVEVQNHSYDMHQNNWNVFGIKKKKGESKDDYTNRLSSDIMKAQNAILKQTGKTPNTFTYPFGVKSRESDDILRELGFVATLGCAEKTSEITRNPESLFNLGRFVRESGISSSMFFETVMKLKDS